MKLCRVLGSVVATAKHPTYVGRKLLWCSRSTKRCGHRQFVLAVDDVQAGPGDVVLVMQEGNGVRQLLKAKDLLIRSLIVGIVDRWRCRQRTRRSPSSAPSCSTTANGCMRAAGLQTTTATRACGCVRPASVYTDGNLESGRP